MNRPFIHVGVRPVYLPTWMNCRRVSGEELRTIKNRLNRVGGALRTKENGARDAACKKLDWTLSLLRHKSTINWHLNPSHKRRGL